RQSRGEPLLLGVRGRPRRRLPGLWLRRGAGQSFLRRVGGAPPGRRPGGPAPGVPAGVPAPPPTPPRHIAERIRTTRPAVEGERKQVTVLFADMKGSLELLADRDPEEARALLDPVLELMMEAVHRYEGTVNQV